VRVLALIKRVPAPGARITLTDDQLAVDDTHLGHAISPHEECAVEAAIALVEEHGGTSTVMSLGSAESIEQLRYAVSVGVDQMVLVSTDSTPCDPQQTARCLHHAIDTLEADQGAFDLILFGNESADAAGFQVGIRVAHALDRPMVNGVKALELAGSEEGSGSVVVRREVDGGLEVYELPLPACVGVKEGLNLPRYPTMRGRLASKKADLATLDPTGEPGGQEFVRLVSPPEVPSETEILGRDAEAVAAVVDLFDELGVL